MEWRARTGLHQPEGAKRCKIDDRRYGKLERADAKEPRPSELERVASVDVNRQIGVDWIGIFPNLYAAMKAQENEAERNGDGNRQQ